MAHVDTPSPNCNTKRKVEVVVSLSWSRKAEAVVFVTGQLGLSSKFQASQYSVARSCLREE